MDATYRSDLDRWNELNFARFGAKLEQRFAEQDAKWEQRTAHLEVLVETGLAHLRTDLIRWMFAFWTGSVLTFGGLLFAALRSHVSP